MTETDRNFREAEDRLRWHGSNLWFGQLSRDWQEFLVANTVEFHNEYEATIDQAAQELLKVYRQLVTADPSITSKNPWETNMVPPEDL